MAGASWGVTEVTIRYVSQGRTWEVSLDPKQIDILVFNWERYEKIAGQIGTPVTRERHIQPDGRGPGNRPAAEVARAMGLKRPPRDVGPAEAGTSLQPVCLHNEDCTWWCIDESHDHS